MFENMENLKIISSLHQASKPHSKIVNRTSHGFLMRLSGKMRYDFEDKSIVSSGRLWNFANLVASR